MLSKKIHNDFISLCYSIYPKKITANLINDEKDFFPYLKKNRLDHYFALKYKTEKKLINDYANYKKKIIDSLKIIKKNLKKTPFLVIKTFSCYPHITSDLDIIIKDNKIAEKYKNLHLTIPYDINDRISWTNSPEISKTFIWENIQKYNFNEIKILVPNSNLDVLIRMAHLPFEQAELKLGEFLHICNQLPYVNWRLLEKEAKKNGWLKTFNRIKTLFYQLYYDLFFDKKLVKFPYRLSFLILAQAIIEKRAWRKILGAKYIINDRLRL